MGVDTKKVKVLFVCMGNICRSPTAEGVFLDLIKKEKVSDHFEVDSAGTHGYHVGELADPRTRSAASARGYDLQSRARKFDDPGDFICFDYIFVADDVNLSHLQELDMRGKYADKVFKMTNFCNDHDVTEVPDPYYGGAKGFDFVLDIIEDASIGILKFIREKEKF